jgi:hypothetical protein
MSLSLAIALIVLADLAILGLLAFVAAQAGRLTAHRSATQTQVPQVRHSSPARTPHRTTRSGARTLATRS